MAAQLLLGKPLAEKIKGEVSQEVVELKAKGVSPSLIAIQVGQNDASRVYTNAQRKVAEAVGIKYDLQELPADLTQDQLPEAHRRPEQRPERHRHHPADATTGPD